jgi:aminoglycoside phosphotransferase (APT) family kinase protein
MSPSHPRSPPGADITATQSTEPGPASGPAVADRARELVLGELLASLRRRVLSTGGYHHRNYLQRLSAPDAAALGLPSGSSVLLRARRSGTPELVQRTWPQEGVTLSRLAAARDRLGGGWGVDVPQVVEQDNSGAVVLLYVEGRTLDQLSQAGQPVPPAYLGQIAGFFAQLARLTRSDVPALPADWPDDGDSTGFLRDRVSWAADHLSAANQAVHGGLLAELGVPRHAMDDFGSRLPELRPRPFALLHTDVHRRNIVVQPVARPTGEPDDRLRFIDWEHAMFGDPLHDLATHLCRMRYPAWQQRQLITLWREAVARVSPGHAHGLDRDLPVYLAYERAQSVYPDVIRAVTSLGAVPEPATVHQAVLRVEAALRAAAEPLRLSQIPDRDVLGKVLCAWRERRPRR